MVGSCIVGGPHGPCRLLAVDPIPCRFPAAAAVEQKTAMVNAASMTERMNPSSFKCRYVERPSLYRLGPGTDEVPRRIRRQDRDGKCGSQDEQVVVAGDKSVGTTRQRQFQERTI